jgi:hypothetical protein
MSCYRNNACEPRHPARGLPDWAALVFTLLAAAGACMICTWVGLHQRQTPCRESVQVLDQTNDDTTCDSASSVEVRHAGDWTVAICRCPAPGLDGGVR